jgi:hypothetical protein
MADVAANDNSDPQASEAVCSCPTGDGPLRHPCAVHPTNHQQPAGEADAWFDLF